MIAVLIGLAVPARAQSHAGLRLGVSADPGQFFVGGHVETRPIADHLTLRPNVEVGFGHDITLVALNFELAYWFPKGRRSPWSVYAGGGPAAIIASAGDHGETDSGGGLNLMLGAQHRDGFFTEAKVGMIDSPSFKFTIGYAFK